MVKSLQHHPDNRPTAKKILQDTKFAKLMHSFQRLRLATMDPGVLNRTFLNVSSTPSRPNSLPYPSRLER